MTRAFLWWWKREILITIGRAVAEKLKYPISAHNLLHYVRYKNWMSHHKSPPSTQRPTSSMRSISETMAVDDSYIFQLLINRRCKGFCIMYCRSKSSPLISSAFPNPLHSAHGLPSTQGQIEKEQLDIQAPCRPFERFHVHSTGEICKRCQGCGLLHW